MRTEKNILLAFVLNLLFSVFEFAGGAFTGSVAIISDALHDMGDAASIGISCVLEKKSRQQPDETYTYGYGRYSVLGSVITMLILLAGSAAVMYHAVHRIANPAAIDYDGMIIFAVIGVCVNGCAAWITRAGASLNQKAVNLHMLEDVLGWVVVLMGAVVMRFTGLAVIDPILSVGVALWMVVHVIRHLKEALGLLLERTPPDMDVKEIIRHVSEVEGVLDVHHIHVWSVDGQNNYATMHIVTNADPHCIKETVRKKLNEYGIGHVTLELEAENEPCSAKHCHVDDAGDLKKCHPNHHH